MTHTSMFLTRDFVANVIDGLRFAGAQMGGGMPPGIAEAYRAGYMTGVAAVAISLGVAEDSKPKITVVVPERLRLGGAR